MWPEIRVSDAVSLEGFGIGDVQTFVREVLEAVFRCEERALRLSVYLCGSEEMCRLHGEWLNDETDTDVLSFGLEVDDDAIALAQGELVVCVDFARRSASEYGNAAKSELALYLVHGALHLLGYDDADSDCIVEMKRAEKCVLDELSYSLRGRHEHD